MTTTPHPCPEVALCCVCGQLRTVSAAFRRRDDNWAADLPPGYGHVNGWRMTVTLKCSHCNAMTRHARLRSDANRDIAEADMAAGL